MKFLFAPDSFKGSLTAMECTALLDEAARRHFPGIETVLVPLADGGEGTLEALGTSGSFHTVQVTGPMGQKVTARYAILGDGQTAVLEMAQASGLPLVPKEQRDPRKASTYGTGEMLLHVIHQGIRKVLMGIGGSATNDGGMGFLQALGAVFRDENGRELQGCGESLAKVRQADFSGLLPQLQSTDITVICDVTNPLLGPQGATAIYGPQKGVTGEMLPELEAGMSNYAAVLQETLGRDIASFPGAGAAGGLGAALHGVLGAAMRSGIDAVLDALSFDKQLQGVDLAVTGEGRIDSQSVQYGKVPAGVAKRCALQKIPLCVIAGGMEEGAQALYNLADASIFTTIRGVTTIEDAMANARELLLDAADRMFRFVKIGMGLKD